MSHHQSHAKAVLVDMNSTTEVDQLVSQADVVIRFAPFFLSLVLAEAFPVFYPRRSILQ